MTLANCVQQVLCGLTAATRNAIVALLQGYVAQLDLLKAALEAQLVYLNILSVPPQIANSLVQTVISEVKAGANLIPLDLIGDCFSLGQLNAYIQTNIDIILADANIIANDLSRLLSFGDEIRAEIADLEAVITFYQDIITTINVCPQVF